MPERWINAQPQATTTADYAFIRANFDGVLAILDWENPAIAFLQKSDIPVKMWRWTQSPLQWTHWPEQYIKECPNAVFANEPDQEGFPEWYALACTRWQMAGGKLWEPAYSDERNRQPPHLTYDGITCHIYETERANLDDCYARRGNLPLIVTEYGYAHHPEKDLRQVSDIPYPVAVFALRWAGNSDKGYDVAGTVFDAPAQTSRKDTTNVTRDGYCTEIGPDGSGHRRCGAAALASAMKLLGWDSDSWGLTLEVATKIPDIETDGATPQQLIDAATSYGLKCRTWVKWQEAVDALAAGEIPLCLLDNWYLQPRCYPSGSQWDALHWLTLVATPDPVSAFLYDPLVLMPGEYPTPYQGPTVASIASLRLAIQATSWDVAGVIVSK